MTAGRTTMEPLFVSHQFQSEHK